MSTTLVLVITGLAVAGWVLHACGRGLIKALEAVAVILAVFTALWMAAKGTVLGVRWLVRHWRSSLTALTVALLCWLLGWPSLAVTVAAVASGLGVWWLVAWQTRSLPLFDAWAGRHLRTWWVRWMVYARRMPRWFRACRLVITEPGDGITINVNPFRRTGLAPRAKPRRDQVPRVTRCGTARRKVSSTPTPGPRSSLLTMRARSWRSRRTWCGSGPRFT